MSKVSTSAPPAKQSGRQRRAAANTELASVSDHLEAQLREQHPELFDHQGRLLQHALTKQLLEIFCETRLTKTDVVDTTNRTEGLRRAAHG